jgi:DNA-binding transcriptional LysR family regulator
MSPPATVNLMPAVRRLVRYRAISYFDAVRRYGSIREAARRLNVAASAVNRQLLRFEEDAGMPLFERLADGMKLTAAGEVFARHVITVLQDEKRAASELDDLRGLRRGELSVIAADSLSCAVLPDLLADMADRHPAVRLTVQSAGSNFIPSALLSGGADVGLAFSLPLNPQLQQLAHARLPLGAVMRPDHPLAAASELTLAACAAYPLLLPTPRLYTHATLAPYLAELSSTITIAAEVESIELMRNLTLRLNAICFLARPGIETELRAGRLVQVPLRCVALVSCDLGVYVRRGRGVSAALDAFVTLTRDHLIELESAQANLCCRSENSS